MTILRFLMLFLLLVGSIGPGLWLVRRLPWSAPERLCAAIGASGIFLYLTSTLIYLLHLPRFSFGIVSLVCLGFAFAGREHGSQLLSSREVRRTIGAFAFLFLWALLFLAMVRNFSGAAWCVDWAEHYQRTQFFLEHLPSDTLFFSYTLPARPPFMNLLAGHYLGQAGISYDMFQVVAAFLNLLSFFPCCLIARHMMPRAVGRNVRTVLLCLFAASPFVIENADYSATKGLTNAYVILGLCLYLQGWRKSDPVRLAASGLALSAGILVHYSAAPYAILLALHYTIFVLPRRRTKDGLVHFVAAIPGVALMGTWIAWSLSVYGAAVTFGSNTTASAAASMSFAENVQKVALNLYYAIVPHPLRMSFADFRDVFFQPSSWGLFRDYFFAIYQTGLVFSLGCVGGIAVLCQLWRTSRGPRQAGAGSSRFWLGFALTGTVFTIATHPTADILGVAHVCSQPLLLLGIAFLAASFGSLPAAFRVAVIVGCIVDFIAGIFVHFSLQHWLPQTRMAEGVDIFVPTTDFQNATAMQNFGAKQYFGYTLFGDHTGGLFPVLQVLALVIFCRLLAKLIAIGWESQPGRRMGAALFGGLFVLFALGIVCMVGIRPKGTEILAEPLALESNLQAIARSPDSGAAHYNLGLALYGKGAFLDAYAHWIEALLLQPEFPWPRYFAEIATNVHPIPSRKVLDFANEIHLEPDSAENRFYLSLRLWDLNHRELAVTHMEKAVQLDPEVAGGFANLGQMNLELGRFDKSIAAFDAGLKSKPDNPDLHYATARALYTAGRIPQAVDHLREALRLKPDFPQAKSALEKIAAERP